MDRTAAATTAAVVLGCILGLVCANPVHHDVCGDGCRTTTTQRHLQFSHVLELQNKSIARWTLKPSQFNRHIQEAHCHECPDPCLKSEAIRVQVSLTHSMRNNGSVTYCLCTYKLAVGCTCVPKSPSERPSNPRACTFRSRVSESS